jgi:hypothetical protein
MTRRDFGACLSRTFAGIVAFLAVLKRAPLSGAEQTDAGGSQARHIHNRRLFHFAAGSVVLADAERTHLHECIVCQEMAYVLMRQSVPFRS